MGFDRDELVHWLRAAGLRDAVVEDAGEDCCNAEPCGASGNTTDADGEAKAIGMFVAVAHRA
jgi:hypothetical protein